MFGGIQESEVVIPCIRKTDYAKILETGEEFSPIQMVNCQKLKTPMQKSEMVEHLIANTNCAPVLSLKRGAVVMCTVNLDLDQNICNGSQGVVVDFCSGVLDGSQTPVVQFTNGVVKQMEYHYWQSEEYPCIVVGQYPLCLAWALTIHKIQGATLNLAEIDIGNTIFEYGQTYVALSRVKSLEGLYLSAFNPHRIKANPTVKQFYSLMEKRGDSVMDQWWEQQQIAVGGGEGVGGVGGCEGANANPFDKYACLEEEEVREAREAPVIQDILDKGSENSGDVKRIFVAGLGFGR
jgi:hypothetical protein